MLRHLLVLQVIVTGVFPKVSVGDVHAGEAGVHRRRLFNNIARRSGKGRQHGASGGPRRNRWDARFVHYRHPPYRHRHLIGATSGLPPTERHISGELHPTDGVRFFGNKEVTRGFTITGFSRPLNLDDSLQVINSSGRHVPTVTRLVRSHRRLFTEVTIRYTN